jgi:hypothetical protein
LKIVNAHLAIHKWKERGGYSYHPIYVVRRYLGQIHNAKKTYNPGDKDRNMERRQRKNIFQEKENLLLKKHSAN